MFRLIPGFFAGSLVVLVFPRVQFTWHNALLTLLLLACAVIFWIVTQKKIVFDSSNLLGFISVVSAFALGMIYVLVQANSIITHRWPADRAGEIVTVCGKVMTLPSNGESVRFILSVESSSSAHPNRPELRSGAKIQLSWYHPSFPVTLGDKVSLNVALTPPLSSFNPGVYDYEKTLFAERIIALGKVVKSEKNRRVSSASMMSVSYWRHQTQLKLKELKGPQDAKGVVSALVIGDKQGVSVSSKDLFSRMGVSHLIAISGLHIGLVAGWVFWLVRFVWSRTGRLSRRIAPIYPASIGALLVAMSYAQLAGFTVPTQRALVMLAVVLIAALSKRIVSPLNVFMLALLAVLLLDPLAVLSAGFWFSFGAVATILYVLHRYSDRPRWVQALLVQLFITIMMLPLQLLFFQQASFISPLINAIAIPLFSFFIVPFAIVVAGLLYVVPWIGSALGQGLVYCIAQFIAALEWVDSLVPVSVEFYALSPTAIAVLMIGIVAVVYARRWFVRSGLALLLVAMFSWFVFADQRMPENEAEIRVLDVGQGLSVIVRTRNHVLVFDTGAPWGKFVTQAERIVIPTLNHLKVKKLDTLVISHSHDDHSSGLPALLIKYPGTPVFSGEPDALPVSDGVDPCLAGSSWEWDGVLFAFLHPERLEEWSGNNASCVLRISVGDVGVLLTGDIEAPAEKKLAANDALRVQSDLLVVPHHGSRSSSTENFVRQVAPQHAIIPVGYRNQFKHPAPQVVSRYLESDVCVWNSALDGAVVAQISAAGIKRLFSSRRKYGKIWTLVRDDQMTDCI